MHNLLPIPARRVFALAAFLIPALPFAATFTVSKDGRGAFSTIQAAVDKSGKNDIVEILDQANYPEQVTIDSTHNGLTIRATNPDAVKKPTIVFKDVTHQNPKTCQDALSPNKIDFDQNGALRILWAHNITLDGIGVDGGGAAPFNNPNIWGDGVTCNGQLYPLFHGNAAIAIYISGAVSVRRCDITNGYFGISVKDRNQGGAFANFNPADLEKSNIVPLSGFGRVGGHIFEKNRIHNNTWGFFFESAWDLGSTIRYNLMYENHHANAAAAAAVKALSSEGANQPGGAFMFKDVMLTPMAIYNNTFWHNFTLFCGGYRPGAQHLIFNNIFAAPNELWGVNKEFGNSFMEMSPFFVNRMHNNMFAAQTQAPQLDSQKINFQEFDQTAQKSVTLDTVVKFYRSVRIMNNMGNVAQENITVSATLQLSSGPVVKTQPITGVNLPGGLIGSGTDPFAASANVRWYEIKFKSTDPASPDFLSPDWDDPVVKKYVMNGGWAAAGINNSDGQVADLGAVPSVTRPLSDVVIRPLAPALLQGTSAVLNFDLQSVSGDLSGLKVKYIRLVRSIPVLLDGFGGSTKLVVPDPVTVTVASSDLKMGANTITVSGVPAFGATETYAFFEIIAEGTAANGKTATTNVGFIPYRKLDYKFLVEVLDATTGAKATSVKVGETVGLRITPQSASGALYPNPVSPVEAHLTSGSDLVTPGAGNPKLALDKVEGVTTVQVMFTKVPSGGGLEYVAVSGIWKAGANTLAFYGISNGVKILPGDPEKVAFQDPPSKIKTPGAAPVVDPGTLYTVKVEVRDRFDNPVGGTATVSIKSNNPTIGDIDGAATATTDSAGIATFKAKVTTGDLNEIFELEASIPGKPSDKADLKVGKARDKLWLLYADLTKYDDKAELRGSAGQRLAVTIRAGKDPDTKLADRQTDVKVSATPGLAIFANATDADPTYTFKLVNGEAVIYVTGLRAVDNGSLTVDPTSDNTILSGTRSKIYFSFTPSAVQAASFHADNGIAAVDRVQITFKADLKRAPDSISVAWPTTGANLQMVKAGITWSAAAPREVTVKLATPFPAGLSAGTGSGTAYTFDPTTPEIPVQALAFTGVDSVGPLLDTAAVLEKLAAGGDTLFISFNEKIDGARLAGQSLLLIKSGTAPITLNVLAADDVPGKGWRIILADMGAQAPAAGDSLKIKSDGPLTDAAGNHAHSLNRAVVIKLKTKPKPPVLAVRNDQAFVKVHDLGQTPDFSIYTMNPDSSWTAVLVSQQRQPAVPCGSACGGSIPSRGGLIDRPAFTMETDRAISYSVTIFNNLGEFINGFSGDITNAQLGLDERNLPVTGATPIFNRGAKGRYTLKIGWNAKSVKGTRAATGAYILKISAVSMTEDENGKPKKLAEAHSVRFGLVRD